MSAVADGRSAAEGPIEPVEGWSTMSAPDWPAELRELFASPPPEFVASRNALAKRLRAEKRRDEAGAVATLRRPSWIDWALNTVAEREPAAVGDFADAAEVLREAQAASIEGRAGPDLRGALRALRDATTALARRAGRELSGAGRDPETAELTSRLGEIAGLEAAVEQLRGGVLGSADPGEEELFAGLTPAPSRARPSRTADAKTRTRAKRAGEAAAEVDRADDDRAEAEQAEAERAEAEQAEAERAEAQRAEEAAREREARRRELDTAVADARRRREEAAERFAAAQRALDDARSDLDDADEQLDAATADLDRFDADTLAS
jgi:hypothetical protein